MNIFFDTSALVKFFHEEIGSESVTNLLINQNNKIWMSELVRLEFKSALFRRFRNKEIDENQINYAISGFIEAISLFNIEPVGHAVISEAESLLDRFGKIYGLRTLDAIHLGTFNLVAEKDWTFVASDEILCRVIKILGYEIINPIKILNMS